MDPLTSAAASGLRSSMESLDMLSNNLANSQTTGFKGDREFFDLYTSSDASDNPVQMPDIIRNWTNFAQGSLQTTSNPLDLGIAGEGFFSVAGPSGTLYTRNGALRLAPGGKLVTQDGYSLLDIKGKPIVLDPTLPITVDTHGEIDQGGAPVAQMQFLSFNNLADLSKQGINNFRYDGDPKDIKGAPGEVEQGKLEGSNVGPAESTVRLVVVMRQFEMLQKAISIGSDMNHEAIEQVAKIGN